MDRLNRWIGEKIGRPFTREALEQYQLERLRHTVAMAAERSPFYRELYEQAGCGIGLESLKDIEKLPLTAPRNLRESGMGMLCVPPSQISRIVTLDTSGTTGDPKRIYFTQADQELTIDFFHNGMQNLVDETDSVLILMPCKRPGSIGDLLKTGLERLGASVVPYGVVEQSGEYEPLAKTMVESGITSMVAIPGQAAALLETAERAGISLVIKETLRTVLLSAEYVPARLCEDLTRSWGCRVFEHYGMTEMGLGGAVSCAAAPNGGGYHPREADLYFEIIAPETGHVVPDSEYGEVVFTTLTREGMPFIRYRTGDRSRWLTEPCPCGSLLKRLDKVGDRPEEKRLRP